MTLSSLTTADDTQVTLATLECLNTDGLCIRMLQSGDTPEILPMYVTSQGRCVFNASIFERENQPDTASSSVRVHGVLHADAYIGLPKHVTHMEMNKASGKLIISCSNDTQFEVPTTADALITRLQAAEARVQELKEIQVDIETRLSALENSG